MRNNRLGSVLRTVQAIGRTVKNAGFRAGDIVQVVITIGMVAEFIGGLGLKQGGGLFSLWKRH